jgi:hypothetical protein
VKRSESIPPCQLAASRGHGAREAARYGAEDEDWTWGACAVGLEDRTGRGEVCSGLWVGVERVVRVLGGLGTRT